MVASIWRVASIGRVASRLGESVAEGIRLPRVCRWGGSGLLRHADGVAGGAPRPPLEQPLHRRVTAASIVPYNSRYKA